MWFLQAIPVIGKLFSTVDNITNAIKDERIAKINAKTKEDQIRADENIKTLEQRRDLLIAREGRQGRPTLESMVTAVIGMSVAILDVKLLVWDKVAGSFAGCAGKFGSLDGCEVFRTDPLSTELTALLGAVHAFYFLYLAVRK